MIVLDTSALLFWTLHRERLSQPASAAIADADRIAVSAMSIWEIGVKAGRGNLEIPFPIREFADRLERVARVEVVPVDLAIWLENLELDWKHRDPSGSNHRSDCETIRLPAGDFGCNYKDVLREGCLVKEYRAD